MLNPWLRSHFGSPTVGASVTTPIRRLRAPVVIPSLTRVLFLGLGRSSVLRLVGFCLLRGSTRFTRIGRFAAFTLSRVLLLVPGRSSSLGLVGSRLSRRFARLARSGYLAAFSLSRVLLLVPRCSSIPRLVGSRWSRRFARLARIDSLAAVLACLSSSLARISSVLGYPSTLASPAAILSSFGSLSRHSSRFTSLSSDSSSLAVLSSSSSRFASLSRNSSGLASLRALPRVASVGGFDSLAAVLRLSAISTWVSAVCTGLSDTAATPASFRGVATYGLLRVESIGGVTSLGGFGFYRRLDAFQIFRRAPWGCRRLG